MDVTTLGMRVERTQVEQADQALRNLTQTAKGAERAVGGLVDQFGRVIQPTTTATYKVSEIRRDVDRLHTTSLSTTRGLTQLRGAFQALAVQAVGVPGPLGRIMSILLQMSAGGTVTLGVLAGIGGIALAWKVFADRAREVREELERTRQTLQRLQVGRIQRGEGLIEQVFGGPSLEETIRRNIDTLRATLDAMEPLRKFIGAVTPEGKELERVIVGLYDALDELRARASGEWLESFLDQIQAVHIQRVRQMTEELRRLAPAMAEIEGSMSSASRMRVLRETRGLATLGLKPLPVRDVAIPDTTQSFWQQNRGQFIGAGLNIVSDIGRDMGGGVGGAITGAAGGFAFGGPVGAAIGGLTGLVSGLLATGAAARQAAEDLRRLDVSIAALGFEISGDRLGAALVANAEQFARLRAEVDKQLPSLGLYWDEVDRLNGIESDRSQRLKALADLEQRRVAQLVAAHAQEQQRERDDLAVRLLRATGMQREAEAVAFALAQQREYEDAVKEGADVFTLAALKVTQAAELMRRALEQRVAWEFNLLDLGTRGERALAQIGVMVPGRTTLTVQEAEDLAFAREQWKEWQAAVLAGTDELTLAYLKNAQAQEAELRLLERARRERELQEDLTVRLLRATSRGGEAEDMAFRLAQEREYLAAMLAGTDATTLALLAEVQLAEARRRESDAVQDQIDLLLEQADAARQVARMLREFGVQAGAGIESPATALMRTRSEFLALSDIARAGDQAAAGRLPGIAQAFLDASRAYNASGLGFVGDTRLVQSTMEELASLFEDEVSAAERQVSLLEDIRDYLIWGISPPTDRNPPGPPPDEQIAVMQAGFVAVQTEVAALREDVQRVVQALEGVAA